jgi:hypothetical protein
MLIMFEDVQIHVENVATGITQYHELRSMIDALVCLFAVRFCLYRSYATGLAALLATN